MSNDQKKRVRVGHWSLGLGHSPPLALLLLREALWFLLWTALAVLLVIGLSRLAHGEAVAVATIAEATAWRGCDGAACAAGGPVQVGALLGRRPPWQRAKNPADSPVVKIVSSRGQLHQHGTGTAIATRGDTALVLTAAHVLSADFAPMVLLADGRQAPASILAADAPHDAALLTTQLRVSKIMLLAEAAPPVGATLTWSGYSGQYGFVFGSGRCGGLDGSWLVVSAECPEGTSGGPIHGDKLVGLISRVEMPPGQPALLKGPNVIWLRSFITAHWPQSGQEQPPAVAATVAASPATVDGATPPASAIVPSSPGQPTPAASAYPLLDRLHQRLADLELRHGQLSERFGKLQQLGGPDPRLPDVLERLGRAENGLAALPAAEKIVGLARTAVGEAVAAGGTGAALAPWATATLTGALLTFGCPPAAAGLAAAGIGYLLTRGVKKELRRITARVDSRYTSTIPAAAAAAAPIVVRQESPPLPQNVLHDRTFVPYQEPNAELTALRWAQEELVRKYPGNREFVDTIDAFAKQYLSGISKTK